jgi:hypothetical protein
MQKMIKITFNLLSEMVKENLSQIQVNQKKILNLVKKPHFDSKKEELENTFKQNEMLLAENIDLIYSQLNVTRSSKKRPAIFPREVSECLELTMAGFVVYHKEKYLAREDKFLDSLNDYSLQIRKFTGTGKS